MTTKEWITASALGTAIAVFLYNLLKGKLFHGVDEYKGDERREKDKIEPLTDEQKKLIEEYNEEMRDREDKL